MATVLLVDDDPDLLESLRAALAQAGFRVLAAQDGAEGAHYLKRERVDAVVTDILMPDHAGVGEMMSSFLGPRGPVVILISGGGPDMDPGTVIGPGWRHFAHARLHKPFRTRELLAELDRLLGTQSAGPAPDAG